MVDDLGSIVAKVADGRLHGRQEGKRRRQPRPARRGCRRRVAETEQDHAGGMVGGTDGGAGAKEPGGTLEGRWRDAGECDH
eukprot:scaffold2858_cov659-Pavlova_lutheri.AAC.233